MRPALRNLPFLRSAPRRPYYQSRPIFASESEDRQGQRSSRWKKKSQKDRNGSRPSLIRRVAFAAAGAAQRPAGLLVPEVDKARSTGSTTETGRIRAGPHDFRLSRAACFGRILSNVPQRGNAGVTAATASQAERELLEEERSDRVISPCCRQG